MLKTLTKPLTPSINPIPALAELELTGACQLACDHCLTSSHPGASHGTMSLEDWKATIRQLAAAGTSTIQLIGGEPTASPHWRALTEFVLTEFPHLRVQINSNLYHVPQRHWEILAHPRIALGVSYYSDVAAEHDRVTRKPGSHARTRGNILEALRRDIPLQIGIVRLWPGQRVEQARAEMIGLGIPDYNIAVDDARPVGRANPIPGTDAPVSELCGNCGDGRLAVLPDGTVTPCVLGRALRAGNLKSGEPLADILAGSAWAEFMALIPRGNGACPPGDSNDCAPASTIACAPAYPYTDTPVLQIQRADA